MKYVIPTCFTLMMLTACGGGGGSEPVQIAAASPEPAPTVVVPSTPPEVPVEESTEEETAEESATEPTEESTDQTAGEPAEESVAEPTEEPAEELTEEPVATFSLSRVVALEDIQNVIEVDAGSVGGSANINVPNGFVLEAEQTFRLRVQHQKENADAYLSVCSEYTTNEDGSYDINYDSCMMRASLDGAEYETDIVVTNDIDNLVAALWFFDTEVDPIYTEWTIDESLQ